MKSYYRMGAAALLLALPLATLAQTPATVGIGTTTPNPAAALDISSSTQGLLPPRLTLAQRTAMGTGNIAAPVAGLVIYQTTNTPGLYQYSGTAWTLLKADDLGNHTATQNLNLGTNQLVGNGGSQGLRIGSTGNVGIGTVPTATLDVAGSTRLRGLSTAGVVTTDASGNLSSAAPTTYSGTDFIQNQAGSIQNGSFRLSGNGTLGGALTASFSSVSGNSTVGGGLTASSSYVSGNSTVSGGLTAGSVAAGAISAGSSSVSGISTAGFSQVYGNSTVGGGLTAGSSVVVDDDQANPGSLANSAPALRFGGVSSGEAIASKRSSGMGQYGLDFYTASAPRLSIDMSGNVGIGTAPAARLDVNGYLRVAGASNAPVSGTVPSLAYLRLTATLPASAGAQVVVAHGLSDAKIIGMQVLVDCGNNNTSPPGFTDNSGELYFAYLNGNRLILRTGTGSTSSVVQGKTARILLTYEP